MATPITRIAWVEKNPECVAENVRTMRIALIADVFPPLRSSGAVQLRDLSLEFAKQGHDETMMVAAPELDAPFRIEEWCGVRIVRLKTPKTKDIGYVRRTINEFLMPFAMLRNLRKSPLAAERWDGIAWYSPTIFLGPMVSALKRASAISSFATFFRNGRRIWA